MTGYDNTLKWHRLALVQDSCLTFYRLGAGAFQRSAKTRISNISYQL